MRPATVECKHRLAKRCLRFLQGPEGPAEREPHPDRRSAPSHLDSWDSPYPNRRRELRPAEGALRSRSRSVLVAWPVVPQMTKGCTISLRAKVRTMTKGRKGLAGHFGLGGRRRRASLGLRLLPFNLRKASAQIGDDLPNLFLGQHVPEPRHGRVELLAALKWSTRDTGRRRSAVGPSKPEAPAKGSDPSQARHFPASFRHDTSGLRQKKRRQNQKTRRCKACSHCDILARRAPRALISIKRPKGLKPE
jgi:hypothetical protein